MRAQMNEERVLQGATNEIVQPPLNWRFSGALRRVWNRASFQRNYGVLPEPDSHYVAMVVQLKLRRLALNIQQCRNGSVSASSAPESPRGPETHPHSCAGRLAEFDAACRDATAFGFQVDANWEAHLPKNVDAALERTWRVSTIGPSGPSFYDP